MIIVCGVKNLLHGNLESILTLKLSGLEALLNGSEGCYDIDRRLLVAGRRVLEVGQSALELQGIIVVLEKLECNGRIEGRAEQAVVGKFSRKQFIC